MPRYTLMEKIGEGGMGLVYRAHQHPLGREVALKVLRVELAHESERLRRFQREVAACIKLAHPNIVKILDSGELDGKHYYVMELLLDGRPLDAALKEQGPFAAPRAAEVAAQTLDALQYCHEAGIFHRDVKPANIMLRPGGLVTLMDFGLAKDNNASTLLTIPGQAMGTPRYMAPECFDTNELTGSIDVWAVGCTLYEMLTGSAPFDGMSILEIATRIAAGGYLPASVLRPDLPPGTDILLGVFLEKEPQHRFPNAAAAAEEVRAWARGDLSGLKPGASSGAATVRAMSPAEDPLLAPAIAKSQSDASATPLADTPAAGRADTPVPRTGPGAGSRSRRRRRARIAAAVLAGSTLVGGLIGLSLRRPVAPPPASVAAPAASVSALTVTPGASSLEVAFEGARGELTVEGEVRDRGAPVVVKAIPARGPAGFVARLAGLPPGARVRVYVRGADGWEIASREAATLPLNEGVERLVATLTELNPLDTSVRIMQDVERALREKDDRARAHMLEQARRRGEARLREFSGRRRVEALVDDLAPVVEAALTSASVPLEKRRRLYELITELAELEDVAARSKVAFAPLASRLHARGYGQIEKRTLVKPAGVAIVYNHGKVASMRADLGVPESFPAVLATGEHLITYSDLRIASKSWMGKFGDGYATLPEPLVLPKGPRGTIELVALLNDCPAANGIRVLVSSRLSHERSAWKMVAQLRSSGMKDNFAVHTVPGELLAASPLHIRIEYAYSNTRFTYDQKVEQECWLRWLAFTQAP